MSPRRLPALPAPLAALAGLPGALALGVAVNLAAGARLPEALAPLIGKTVALRVTDLGLDLCVAIGDRGFRARLRPTAPDATISACAADFAALARRKVDPDSLFFSRRLVIEGDTELGLAVKNALDALPLPRLPDFAPARVLGALRAGLFG
ncbi:MAG TPA: SCP2 sterol-binding domain-containing protein [Burkholderiales bacterium]|nr:SCP2 sterol-binding domain-containing protein [Burkholderiales bacterium]